MRIFYVRPERASRYGAGDGTSYENAWNGFASIDWAVLAAFAPVMVAICGDAAGRDRLIALEVDWNSRASLKKAA
jgi:hypothetical protein